MCTIVCVPTEQVRHRGDAGDSDDDARHGAPGPAGVGAAAKGGAAGKAEEKVERTAFDLKLESFEAAAKIKLIKEVRWFTNLGLKEEKDLVEKAPAVMKKRVLKEDAVKIIEKMKEVGAKVVME